MEGGKSVSGQRQFIMFKKIKTILRNNKAFSNLELAIGALIMITVISVGIELSTMAIQHNVVSSNINYIARIVEQQGGISNTKPSHYKGSYTTSKTVYNGIKSSLNHVGIADSEWKLKIGTQTFSETYNKSNIPYGTRVTISLTYKHQWPLISHFFPSLGKIERTLNRQIITTHYPRESGTINYN